MRDITALIIKLVTCLIAYAVGLDLFFNAVWTQVVWFSVLTMVVSYLADRIALSHIGNMKSLIADFLLSYMIVWIFGSVLLNSYMQIAWGSIISAVIITAGEFFVHRLLLNTQPEDNRDRSGANHRLAYGMEMSEEDEPIKKK